MIPSAPDRTANHAPDPCAAWRRLVVAALAVVALAPGATPGSARADTLTRTWPLTSTEGLHTNGVVAEVGGFEGRRAVVLTMESDLAGGDSNTIAVLEGSDFHDGTIEFDLASGINPDSWFFVRWIARGFAGIAFRVADDLSSFESIYLRPENGQADDPVRRSHAVQYFAYPDWTFSRFREEAPGVYEAPADIEPNRWTRVRVEVRGARAELWIDDAPEPSLVVEDLKLGADARGAVALFIDAGTRAHFANVTVTSRD